MAGRRAWPALVAALTLGAGACRDAVEPYHLDQGTTAEGDTVRLSYSPGEDRSPAWIGNDSVIYSPAGFDPFPLWPGILAMLPAAGGTASLALPSAYQSPIPMWFATPVPSPSGDRIAFVDLTARDSVLCPNVAVYSSEFPGAQRPPPGAPMLVSARLIVRPPAPAGPLTGDPQLVQQFDGVKDTTDIGFPGYISYIVRDFPYQRSFRAGGGIPFRPSWSPDGQKLVFSDGHRLLVWTVGQAAASPLVGGEGGYTAAWSPGGDQIAFTRATVLDSTTITYTYASSNGISCGERRIRYMLLPNHVFVVPATGGTPRDLGDGDEPAWSPDGSTIYARNFDDQVVRIPAAGGTPTVLPGLRYSHDLAVSPDGNWLALTRITSPGNHDVWVVRLSH